MKGPFLYKSISLGRSVEFYLFLLNKIFTNRYWLYTFTLLSFNIANVVEKVGWDEGKITILNTMWSPFWLLLGPLCFLANRSLSNPKKNSLNSIHLLPGILYIVFYAIVNSDLIPDISEELKKIYWFSVFLVPISLVLYSMYIIADRTRDLKKIEPVSELMLIISCFYVIIALLYFLVGYFGLILDLQLTINYRYFIYGLLVVVTVFIVVYLWMEIKRNTTFKPIHPSIQSHSYSNSKLKPEQIDDYKKRIEEHFNQTQCFLQSNLSLEDLSRELNIPPHRLSQVFNLYLGSNFYGYVAKYRIEYALVQLKLNKGKLKIEALAYQCGFNSRSSFIRYFKEITGCNPSEYCQKLETTFTD